VSPTGPKLPAFWTTGSAVLGSARGFSSRLVLTEFAVAAQDAHDAGCVAHRQREQSPLTEALPFNDKYVPAAGTITGPQFR
jgi:hypothetical protein